MTVAVTTICQNNDIRNEAILLRLHGLYCILTELDTGHRERKSIVIKLAHIPLTTLSTKNDGILQIKIKSVFELSQDHDTENGLYPRQGYRLANGSVKTHSWKTHS